MIPRSVDQGPQGPGGTGGPGAYPRRVDVPPDPRYLYPPEEAARRLGVSRTRVYGLMNCGLLTRIKNGRRTLVADREVQELVKRLLAEPWLLAAN